MNNMPNQEHVQGEKAATDANELIRALDDLHPSSQQQKTALFSKVYPGILRALGRNVSQKKILAELERLGLKLHPTRFKAMLEAEAKALRERGDQVCCDRCGSMLGEAKSSIEQEVA